MAKKKTTQLTISQEDTIQAQHVLEQYHELASTLHISTDRKQAEAALTQIGEMAEAAQMALLKALSKEQHSDAADVLLALNELSPMKSVRKEARRSLIRLEEARIYPQWSVPIEQIPAMQLQVSSNPPRFWKGVVTDSLNVGEVELILCWEQGEDYREVRVLGFLLEFGYDGVKDFFTRVESKRAVDNFINRLSARLSDVPMKSCSLATGRRLLLDALAVNKRRGTTPHKDYRMNLPLVNRLILEAPDLDLESDLDEEDEESIDIRGLKPQEVVVNFVESWVNGSYEIAYALLSGDSPIREGLSKEEWIERRETWADEANPDNLKPNFIHEREPKKSILWLPNFMSAARSNTSKEFEVGWSIELDETPLSGTLPELPQATAIYPETGRHWFWTSYTLVQEQDEWRIQSITDEGTNAQSFSIEELQKRIQEQDDYLEDFTKKHTSAEALKFTEEEALGYFGELLQHVMKATYYSDVLIKKLPLDRQLYEDATGRLIVFVQYERCLTFLEPLTRRFAEHRGLHLRQLGVIQKKLSEPYFEEGDDERGERCLELAEEALRESLAIEDTFQARITLAEVLIEMGEHLDEAEEQLLQAKGMTTDPGDEAHIELHLGEIAMEREHYEEALSHYQHVVEYHPNSVDSWLDVAYAQQALKHFEEAEASYRRAKALEPDDPDIYFKLSRMYSDNNQPLKAIDVLEEGLSNNPDSAILTIYLATLYLESGDYRQAEIFLEKAERIDPEAEFVQMFRQVLNLSKLKLMPARNENKLGKPKKKRGR